MKSTDKKNIQKTA